MVSEIPIPEEALTADSFELIVEHIEAQARQDREERFSRESE